METKKENTLVVERGTNEKLISVIGKGGIHIAPDVTRVELRLESLHDTYQQAYAQSKHDTQKVRLIMEETGLDIKQPKTIRFNIDKKTINEYDKHGHYVGSKFVGYEVTRVIKIDLGMDNFLLNKIIKKIGQYLPHAEINIGHTVRDTRSAQLKMLHRAIKDAKEKAEIMAEAAGCKLGMCKSINYGVNDLQIYSEARNIHSAAEACCCSEDSLDITPDDLAVADTVEVIWYLSNGIKKEKC